MQWIRIGAALAAVLGALVPMMRAQATGTAAGTTISNTAHVSYTVGSATVTTSSNASSINVAEILDAVMTIGNASVSVAPSATQQELVFTVTNTGNGSEAFVLTGLSTLAGDNFDPSPAATFIYFDSDNSGDLSPADVAYVAGSNDPVLAADASVRVMLVNDIPNGVTDGQRGRSQLTAAARTGVGTAGTTFAGQGDGGVDAVVGTTGADAQLFGEYLVAGLQLTALKSQSVQDQFGGSRPVPGARISYQIVVTANGSGTALAAAFSDLIPATTTYVVGSLKLNNAVLTDNADADAGLFVSAPAPEVRITLGNLTQAAGPQTIQFAVTIN
jgi:uncharacterized repeat protein (TIGR01451 family)